jgi:hypothetical protein
MITESNEVYVHELPALLFKRGTEMAQCPDCLEEFDAPSKPSFKCKHCGATILNMRGELISKDDQQQWLKDWRANFKGELRDAIKD